MSVWMPLFQKKFNSVRDRYCIHFLLWACERCFKLQQSPPAIPTRVGTKYFGEKFVSFATSKISNFQEICMTTTIKF